MPRSHSVPRYRLHRPSGRAVVTIRTADGGRKDVYLGTFNSPESRSEYARVLAELATAPLSPSTTNARPTLVTVDDVLLAFWNHANRYYRGPDGRPTDEVREIKQSVLHLRRLYGCAPAADFGPRALVAVRQAMIDAGWCRTLINRRVERVKRAFRWAAEQGLLSGAVHASLRTVRNLKRWRTEARESEPVGPVPREHVVATLPHLTPHTRAMVELQLLTGMRPGEVCALALARLDRAGEAWVYRPAHHKTAHLGHDRAVPLGPKARALLLAFLARDGAAPDGFAGADPGDPDWRHRRRAMAAAYRAAGLDREADLLADPGRRVVLIGGRVADPDAPLFSPAQAQAEWAQAARRNRKSKVPPSQESRRVTAPKRAPGARYTVAAYGHTVRKAAAKAGVPHWHPNQLRHTLATEVRRAFGLEAAQVLLGHASADVTQVYAERDFANAARVAHEIG